MAIINPNGQELIRVETDFFGKKLSLEYGLVGFRTTASVLARYGETVVLGTAMSGGINPNLDYFPLSIDYEEKFYATGKISGSRFIKREGRPSDEAVLIGRLIDRPVRPLFPKGYRNELQLVATVLSSDPTFRPDAIAMIAASSALMLSGAPFDGPVAGLRIGLDKNGDFATFLSREEMADGQLDLFVAGTENGVMMVEAGAKEVSEDQIADAIEWALDKIKPALALQKELRDKIGVEAKEYELVKPNEEIQTAVDKWLEGKLGAAVRKPNPERNELIQVLRDDFHTDFADKIEEYDEIKAEYDEAFTLAVHNDVRKGILEDNLRPDGRQLDEVRQLSSEVSLLPRAHGSSLFTRGVTQALNIVTLAPLSYAQVVDTMESTDGERRYMHHYNAPGYTVGEVKRLGSAGRREIGHGYLAERALIPVLPDEETFPYAIRSVTEIMSQNGSTSMAATCSSCMALMDAGVPILRPVSGVAMGLMLDGDKPYILTDLMDAEDFAGDMDFKVTGTSEGITALQMDMKVHGLPADILRQALNKAKTGRKFILDHMLSVIPQAKTEISKYAPQIDKLMINPDKIGAIIGKGGETINAITKETGVEIDIKEDGLVTFASNSPENMTKAIDWVKSLVEEPEVGKIYEGKVVTIKDFGAFVNIMPGIDGMLHISQISDHRIDKVTDVLHEGDTVRVKLQAIDDRGKLSLTMRDVPQVQ
ncbi:MAG: polyribonucleotide nucleotidyltransferase [Candidatus Nomurabacteria bacterium]|jgi:polyribonucleotide nucleotidyltransferase|nr:polyribonucleotide nucleotidyltransferase [Candidatus Nomurabacteria bacterium]